ncbi:DHA2 family efflux MFS transporter permease subunit [uncultured Sanguibacteroides sp.]|uniref:DHA2 family efflux MFS transporter permease subunit n=1 Tax=uncultured Sanguibacteroides sp. TaxID=1635151 RepID=UPI0025D8D34A|nr:DHA2 family efflux MFS transporter permease subunit [uncultured Sanguibacteroides sp.]
MDTDRVADASGYKWLVLFNVMLTTFMAVLDSTVVNTGLPVIMGTLGASMNSAEWILTGYMLSMATILPAAGWLSDRFGYKNIFIFSLIVFTLGSFMCGNSSAIEELVFWRVFQGIGGGLLMPAGMAIVTTAFPVNQRGMALGFWAIASAASVSFGPLIGGYLVDNLNWNYIFYVNVPIGIFSIIFTLIVQKPSNTVAHEKFDFWGFLTSAIFLPVFLYGLSQVTSSTNTKGWSSPVVLGCMWTAVVSFILFLYVELTVKHPLVNLRIFRDHNFSFANLIIFIFGIGMFGSTFLIPLYMQNSLGYSAYQTGMFFMPVGFLQAVASPSAGALSRRFNPKIIIVLGLLLLCASFYMNYSFSFLTDKWYIMSSLYLRGVGLGILYPPLLNLSLKMMRNEQMAQASSITNIIRQIGGSFGVAMFSHLLSQRQTYHTERYHEAIAYTGQLYTDVIDGLTRFFSSAGGLNHSNAVSYAKQYLLEHIDMEAYISGINDVFYIAFVITLLAIIPVFLLKVKN